MSRMQRRRKVGPRGGYTYTHGGFSKGREDDFSLRRVHMRCDAMGLSLHPGGVRMLTPIHCGRIGPTGASILSPTPPSTPTPIVLSRGFGT